MYWLKGYLVKGGGVVMKIKIKRHNYINLKLIPNNSIRNNNTYKLARTIATLYRNLTESFKKVEDGYIYYCNCKVSYFVDIGRNKADFYLVIPEDFKTIFVEKISEVWNNVTIEEVKKLPDYKGAIRHFLIYKNEDALSLNVDKRANKLLESNLNLIEVLQEEDKVGIFYNFMPCSQHSWNNEYKETIQKYNEGFPIEKNKISFIYLLKLLFVVINNLFDDLSCILGDKKEKKGGIINIRKKELSESTINKGTDIVLNTQIITMSKSEDKIRQENNARSINQSFDTISEDNLLVVQKMKKEINYYNKDFGVSVNKISANECNNFLCLPGRELLERYPKITKVQTQETEIPKKLSKGAICIGENIYRGNKQKAYLSSDFDLQMLALVVIGPNRAGKSKLLANIAKNAIDNGECVIIPDYIGSCQLSEEITEVIPKVLEIRCDDYENFQGLGYNEVPKVDNPFIKYKNAKEQTALLMTLVDSINSDDASFTARMSKYFEAASLTVFLNNGSIKDVFSVLMNFKIRKQFINKIPEEQKEMMQEYVDYLNELDQIEKGKIVGTRTHLITGAIDRLQRLKINAYLEQMLKIGTENNINLVEEIQKSQLIVIKMPQRMFLTDNEKDIYVTYWLTKIWLALQIREEQIRDRNKMLKVNLIIDELYQVNNAEKFLTKKLSQLPKFNLKPIISCHYLNQIKIIREELRSANASYMLLSGCDKKNFKELESELYPFLEEDLLNLKRYNSLNLIKYEGGYARFITKLPNPLK
jgi:hypothetical protein